MTVWLHDIMGIRYGATCRRRSTRHGKCTRHGLSFEHQGCRPRRGREPRINHARFSGTVRVAEPDGDRRHGASTSGSRKAVLLSFRLNDNALRSPAVPTARTGGTRCPRSSTAGVRPTLPSRRASAACRAAIVRRGAFIAQGRGADAELRQPRRLCRREFDDRHLGDGRQLRADRIEGRAHLGRCRDRRRARAAPGGSRSSSATARSSARAAEVAEGVRVGEGAVLSMGVYLGASDQDRRPRDRGGPSAVKCRRTRWSSPAAWAAATANRALYCAVIVKRVDAQTRSEDQHQRVAARLT